MYAHAAILEALIARGRSGEGRAIQVSLFSAMVEWMTPPILHKDYAGTDWPRVGLNHPSISPYGAYKTGDGAQTLIAVQNDKEFERLANIVLEQPGLSSDPRFATNMARNQNRVEMDRIVTARFAALTVGHLTELLNRAEIAYARVSTVADVSAHPQLRRTRLTSETGAEISLPALAASFAGQPQNLGKVPALGEHNEIVRKEFA
jgi:crotonobetainyl-CoA:carnitine CoA-transferase CaiB-like acyl-CoA transferase